MRTIAYMASVWVNVCLRVRVRALLVCLFIFRFWQSASLLNFTCLRRWFSGREFKLFGATIRVDYLHLRNSNEIMQANGNQMAIGHSSRRFRLEHKQFGSMQQIHRPVKYELLDYSIILNALLHFSILKTRLVFRIVRKSPTFYMKQTSESHTNIG